MNLRNIKITLLMTAMVFFAGGLTMAGATQKVAVLPFEMNSNQDLTFLQKGLFSMLSSRLADPGKVEVIDRDVIEKTLIEARKSPLTSGTLNESKAKMIGANLNADYILYGAVTIFGGSISLDVSMVDIAKQVDAITFSKQAKEPGAVITELNEIATEINRKVFGREPETFIAESEEYQRPNPVQVEGQAGLLTNYRSLLSLDGEVIGMSSGDVDGDKSKEVVIAYDHAIEIFKRLNDRQLKSLIKIEDKHYLDIVAVDVADINKNGRDEIFITKIHPESGKLQSTVLEMKGAEYHPIADNLPWYMRVVSDDTVNVLYAQPGDANGPYQGRVIKRVVWDNSKYKLADSIMVPEGFSIMGFAMESVKDNTKSSGLYTDKYGKLIVFNQNGKIEWSSDDGYGGTRLYYEYSEESEVFKGIYRDASDGKGVYLQPRNIITDIGEDGVKEAIVIKNKDSAGYLFGKVRRFKNGSIEIRTWNDLGLILKGLPKQIPGQITDILIHDLNDGTRKELMVSLIKNRNTFSSKKSKSIIIAFDI